MENKKSFRYGPLYSPPSNHGLPPINHDLPPDEYDDKVKKPDLLKRSA